jgi:uncharacterized protein
MKAVRCTILVLLGAAIVLFARTAVAQQDEGPIYTGKAKPKPTTATLLVMCDLACNWKLDGEAKGRIDAGGSAKVKVELGQHMVVATTEDGSDQVKRFSEVKSSGQTLINIELQPVRDAHLKAEQEDRDKAARDQAAKDQAAREQAARDQATQEQEARDKAAREKDLRDHAQERENQGWELNGKQRYAEARTLYQQACDGGNMDGCDNLGVLYANGQGGLKDYAQASALYRKACDGGNMHGCANLGSVYESGQGVSQSYIQAFSLHKKACDGGDALGCNGLGWAYQKGLGVPADMEQAVMYYRKSCDGGVAQGCDNLAIMQANGLGMAKDDTQAVALFRKACDGGAANGCSNLGVDLGFGRGVEKNEAQAVELFRKGCDGGDGFGCRHLANAYASGSFNVAKSEVEALALYRKGCDGGDGDSCGAAGQMYLRGNGIKQDKAEALALFRKGCEASAAFSCGQAGRMYRTGDGVAQDKARAVELLRSACDKNYLESCAALGLMYDEGEGVAPDKDQALALYRKGCVSAGTGCHLLYEHSKHDAAIASLNLALTKVSHPDGKYSDDEARQRYWILIELANAYGLQQKTPEAIAEEKQVIDLGGNYVGSGYFGEIYYYREANQSGNALSAAAEAAKTLPRDRNIQLAYASLLAENGEPEQGLAIAKAQLNGSADDIQTEVSIGDIYFSLDRDSEAQEHLDKAKSLATTPQQRQAIAMGLNNTGYPLADKGEHLPEALKMLEEAAKLFPDNGPILDSLGWAYFKLGQYGPAEENLNKALTLDTSDSVIYEHLGDVYEKTGRYELAVGQWDESLKLASNVKDRERVKKKRDEAMSRMSHSAKA